MEQSGGRFDLLTPGEYCFNLIHGQPWSVRARRKAREKKKRTHKLLVMHQDGLLARVDVELDDIALPVAVQKLITCKKGRDEADFKTQSLNIHIQKN